MRPTALESVAIAILAKAPIAGFANTRLIPLLGREGAAALQERFIDRAVATATAAQTGPVTLWASPDPHHPAFRPLAARFPLRLHEQPDGDLGARMHAAIAAARGPAIVVGTDCPALAPHHLQRAADWLRSGSDAVLISAEDGGYVLLGLRRAPPDLFESMVWGSNAVANETRRRMQQLGLRWRELAPLWDVDRPDDIARLRREGLGEMLAGIVGDATASPALLQAQ